MRISDWSSDVCSSDLSVRCRQLVKGRCAEPDALTKWPAFRRSWDFRGEYNRTKPQPGRSAAARCLQAGYIARLSRQARSEARRVGIECVSTWHSRWSQVHEKKKL